MLDTTNFAVVAINSAIKWGMSDARVSYFACLH